MGKKSDAQGCAECSEEASTWRAVGAVGDPRRQDSRCGILELGATALKRSLSQHGPATHVPLNGRATALVNS
jgi:hypothetical protein